MPTWTYPTSRVISVTDGDNFLDMVDQGLETFRRLNCRLNGCNAREHDEEGGPEATYNLTQTFLAYPEVTIQVIKYDKYGPRHQVKVFLPDGTSLIEKLIAEQWLARWDGRGEKPVPPWPRTVA